MTTVSDPRFAQIPPRVVAKALKLPGSMRREYIQTLIGQYDYKLRHLDLVIKNASVLAEKTWEAWRKSQREHLELVTKQLEALRDS